MNLNRRPVTIVAGSNGCSLGARPALEAPGAVTRLIFAWPANAGPNPITGTAAAAVRKERALDWPAGG